MADDPKMQGLRDLFAATRTDDETLEISRPQSGLGGLGRLVEPAVPPATRELPVDIDAEVGERTVPVAATTPRTVNTVGPRRKTSISLQPKVFERISIAYSRDRWTMAQLVEEAAERIRSRRVTPADIERSLAGLGTSPASAIKSLSVPLDDLATLDATAHALRLSRSQVLAAAVTLVIDSLR